MATKSRLDKHHVATILVYALYNTDKSTGRAFGITPRTVTNYRKRLETDSELSEIFLSKKEQTNHHWLDDSAETIRQAMAYIRRASESDDATPEMVHAIAGAMKIVSEVTATHKLIDLRIENARRSGILGSTGEGDRSLAAPVIVVGGNKSDG